MKGETSLALALATIKPLKKRCTLVFTVFLSLSEGKRELVGFM